MTNHRAIQGTYADYRRVKGRKVFQLVIEVPVEMAPEVHKIFGEPSPDGSTWVAVALLDANKAAASQAPQKATDEAKPNGGNGHRRPFHELPRAQQAGIMCGEGAFSQFLREEYPQYAHIDEHDAVDPRLSLHAICHVSTRAHIDTDDYAREQFDDVVRFYRAWIDSARVLP